MKSSPLKRRVCVREKKPIFPPYSLPSSAVGLKAPVIGMDLVRGMPQTAPATNKIRPASKKIGKRFLIALIVVANQRL